MKITGKPGDKQISWMDQGVLRCNRLDRSFKPNARTTMMANNCYHVFFDAPFFPNGKPVEKFP